MKSTVTNDVSAKVVLGIYLVFAVISSACGNSMAKTGPETVWRSESKQLIDDAIEVKSGESWEVNFIVDSTMRNVEIHGEFEASGGSGNDIKAAIAERGQYKNWVNGHSAATIFQTEQTTTGQINTQSSKLGPGEYTHGFNNRFSVVSDKTVRAKIVLSYEQVSK